ncbi:hypothetical protein [Chitinophaga flava]|uniref:hypothetical protein n=1 Tax=Chitinophaga flava TaxID=2259036 RepID=UPI0011BD6617|nr:hypothetical protein [Chitinophaga flava]
MKQLHHTITTFLTGVLILATLIAGCPEKCSAQDAADGDEVMVTVRMQELGAVELAAIIRKQEVYLSVNEMFDFLKIKNTFSVTSDTLSGFINSAEDVYTIEKASNTIVYNKKQTVMTNANLISTASGFYLKSNSWGDVFGLNCAFRFSDLCVVLTTKLDLPILREMRQQRLRDKINRLKGIDKADTIIARKATAFSLSAADWSVMATQQYGGNNTNLNLSLGGELVGGETNIQLNYNNINQLDIRNQQFMWHHVNNDNPLLRQVTVGRINNGSIASLLYPLAGVQFSNTPTLNRTAFGTYRLTDLTYPGWKVELYINNELIDYQQADASGFFAFNVPIIYGNTSVQLRFYGPWGEVRSEQREIIIPFNFLPAGEMNYSVTGGVVLDGENSRYAQGIVNYGVSPHITVGAGAEYLSSIPGAKPIPFTQAAWRVTNNLILSGEYAYGVRSKAALYWRLPFDLEMDLQYLLYQKDQRAVKYNYLEERKASLTLPIRRPNFSLLSRMTVDMITMPPLSQQPIVEKLLYPPAAPLMKYTTVEWVNSCTIGHVNTNLTTFGTFRKDIKPVAYSSLSQVYPLTTKMFLTPRLQYSYDRGQFTNARVEVERSIMGRGFVRLSIERDFTYRQFSTGITLRYDLAFAKTGLSTNISRMNSSVTESASGSLLYDKTAHKLMAGNVGSVGRAQMSILAFLDFNGNGKKDPGEPKVEGLTLLVNGGVVQYDKEDTTYRVYNLEPYRKYLITLNPDGFSSVAWQLKYTTLSALALPNQFRPIEVPVSISGEVSGMVRNESHKGLARIKMNIYDESSRQVASVLTEGDGYFSYLGLPPGKYTVSPDTVQMQRLKMKAKPGGVPVTIKRNTDGDVVDGLVFILSTL